MKRIYTLALVMVLGVLLLPQRWVSLGAPEVSGSVFRQVVESQERQQERQGPPERLVPLSQVDSLPLAEGKIGRDPRRWRALVANKTNQRFQEVFPGVDLVFAGTAKRMEAVLIVKPGVDPASIRFEFPQAEVISHDAQGNLWVAQPDGDLGVMRPLLSRQNEKVSGSFAVDGSRIVLQVQDHDASQGLLVRFDVVFPVRAVNLLDQILYRTFKAETHQPTELSSPEQTTTLTATKSVDLANVAPGGTLMYTVTITNTGAQTANGVQFTDTISNNTTLVGGSVASSPIGQNDTYTATGNIPIAPSSGVLANDVDPDTGNNTGLTVTQVQGSGANVGVATNTMAAGFGGVNGSVTLQSNGSFTYDPPPGFTGDDTFTYRVADAGGKFNDATVTITITNKVWFINNNAGGSLNRGTFTHPFTNIANFNTANTGAALRPAAGDTISLRTGTGTYTETDGVNLLNNQKLIGEGVALNSEFTADANSTAAYTTFASAAGTAPAIVTTGGNGIDLASDNTVRGLNVGNTPGFYGFRGTAVGNLTVATVNKTGTGGAILVSTSGVFGSNVNFGTLESTSSPGQNIRLNNVTGTLGVTAGGSGLSGNAVSTYVIDITGGNVNLNYPGNVNTTSGLVAVSVGHTGTLTFPAGFTVSSNGLGPALFFDNADGNYNFNGTTTLTGGASVLIQNGSGGTFSFGTGASITAGNNHVAVTIDGGTASFTYSGGITKTGNGDAIRVQGGHATGTVTFQTGTISATGGNGLQFDNADGTYNFNGTTTLNGGDAAVDIVNGSSGNFTFSSGATVTNPSGTAFRVDGGNGTITYNGTLSKTGSSGGRLIDIGNRTGGSVSFTSTLTNTATGATGIIVQNNTSGSPSFTFSGATKTLSTGANTAVTLSNNTTSTINFSNGGLDIDTTSGGGFSATGGGTVTVTTGANPNTIDSTTGTALNVANTTIGAGGLTFRSISANGGTNGIVLNTTGSSGGLTVTGNSAGFCGGSVGSGPPASAAATTAPVTADCTGGTIQSTSGAGIVLTNTSNVSLTRVQVINSLSDGLAGTNVTNFTLASSFFDNNGDAIHESGVDFGDTAGTTPDGLHGTCTVTNSTIRYSYYNGFSVRNFNGAALTSCSITGSQFLGNPADGESNDNVFFEASGTANITASVSGSFFASTEGDNFQAAGVNSGTLNINVTNNTFTGGHSTQLGGGITINAATGVAFGGYSGRVDYDINGNNIQGATSNAIIANLGTSGSTAVFDGFIRNNVIGTQGVALSGSSQANGIAIDAHGNGNHIVSITNNTIKRVFDRGIFILANDGNGSANLTVTNNNVSDMLDINGMTGTPREAFHISAGATGTNVFGQIDSHAICLNVTSNVFDSPPDFETDDLRLRQRFRTSIRLPGYGGTAFDTTAVQNFVAANNPGPPAAVVEMTFNNDAGVTTDGYFGGAACTTPTFAPVPDVTQLQQGKGNTLQPAASESASPTLFARMRQWLAPVFSVFASTPAIAVAESPAAKTATVNNEQATGGTAGWSKESITTAVAIVQPNPASAFLPPAFSAFTTPVSYINPLNLFEKSAAAAELPSVKAEGENKFSSQDRPQRPKRTEGKTDAPQRQQPRPPTRILASPESGETVMVGPFDLPPGEVVQIMFSVTVTGTAGCSISNQATVSGTNFTSVTTNAATTAILQAPSAITCPTNIVGTTDPGQCTSVRSFATPTTSAGCPTPTVTCVPASGFAFPVGITTVTCTATNSQGSTNCSFTVTITDAQAPTLTCPAPISVNTAPGVCTATATYAPTIMDNCPGATANCTPPSGSTFPLGVTTVSCTGMDANSNPATPCSFTVTVTDNQNPTIGACPSPISQPAAAGQCSASVTYATPTATDNCGAASVVCAPASGSSFPVGITMVTCTATDSSNRTASCSFTVTINDTQNPVPSCPTNQSVTSNVPIAVNYPAATVMDNCPGATINCAPASGSVFAVGTTTVTCTATDASNNTATCTFTVSVIPCTITCPTNQTAVAPMGTCAATVNYPAPTTTGTCGTVTCSPISGSSFPVGITTVTCSTSAGPSCNFTVTVSDNQNPTLTCPTPIVTNTAPNTCAATVTYTVPTASDNCPNPTVTCSPNTGSSFPRGVTTVTCTAKDASNNMAMCTFTVTVNDTQNPAITCPTNISVNAASGQCSAVATYTTPTPTDNCPGATASCTPASGSTFAVGTTTVTCTATDASNNTATCTFTVTVTDTQNPTLTCPTNITTNAATGQCSAVVSYTVPTPSDNCPGATVACVPNTGSTFSVGTTTVTCTATDAANNTASCNFTVTVTDNQNPTLTCPTSIVTNTAPNTCAANVTYTVPTASDNCPNPTVTCSPNTGSSFPRGVTTVTCTAKDASNNMAMCTFTVTVNDTQNPAITCPTNVIVNAAAGQCSAVATYTTPTPTDNCPGATASCSPASGSTFQVGTTTVTCTATDASNNTATCTFTVRVNDTQNPSITCPANITLNTAAGLCSAVATYATPTPTDNCPGATASCSPASGSTFQRGVTTVTCTATDASNNTATCNFTVTVNDNQNPTITCPANQSATSLDGNPVAVTYPTPTASDNCPGVTTACVPASGANFPLGTTTVTCTATDASNRTATCSFTVTVITCTGITCPSDIFVGTTGNSTTVTYSLPTPNGNCGTITCSPPSGSSFNVGVSTVSCSSSIGNQTCAFRVTVNRVSASVNDPLACTGPGNQVQATLNISNNGNVNQAVSNTTTFTNLVGVPNTCTVTPNVGTCTVTNGSLTYNATLTPGQTVSITYLTQVSDLAQTGQQVCTNNSVRFNGGNPVAFSACDVVDCPTVGPGNPFPARSEASDQSAGSVLIYNVYTSSPSSPNTENTRVSMTNIHPQLSATVHLFFVDGTSCSVADSYVCLTANQTTSFLMSDLDPGTTGYIVAVATDLRGCPINFNYLIGDEYVKFSGGHAANLGAEAYSALPGGLPACNENSAVATINFDGVSYDRTARTVALDSIGSRAEGNDTMLILNRIGGNLGTGAASLGTIFGILYDDSENGVSFNITGGCQLRGSLTNNFPRTTPRFEQFIPAGRTGWMRLYSQSDLGLSGAMINFNAGSASSAGAFNQGHNLHKLTLSSAASYVLPVFPPGC